MESHTFEPVELSMDQLDLVAGGGGGGCGAPPPPSHCAPPPPPPSCGGGPLISIGIITAIGINL
jgi:hypothetical protein